MAIKKIKVQEQLADDRGFMIPLVDEDNFKVKNVLYIFRKKGSISGNHYHKEESYWEFCLSGSFRYYERSIKGSKDQLEYTVVEKGDLVYCPARRVHAMKFLEDSIVICLASRSRKQKAYDADVVKFEII